MEVFIVIRDGDEGEYAIKAVYVSKESADDDAKRRNSLQGPFANQYSTEKWIITPESGTTTIPVNSFKEARKQFCDLLCNDPEMYRIYLDNVAMTIHDAQGGNGSLDLQDHEIRNRVAKRVMEHIFGHIKKCDVGMPVQVSE